MTKEEADLIIAEQNKSKEEILKAVAKVKSDYHELCKLKDMRIAELEAQIEEIKCCCNCRHSRTEYEHCRTDKHEKWEIKENE